MSVDLVSDEAIAAAFWELAEYPEKAPGNRLAFAAACAYIHHRAKELSAALPLLDGVRVAGWQPIDTAPKDGTKLLLWIEYGDTPVVGTFDGVSISADREHHDVACGTYCYGGMVTTARGCKATHWMPLPEPPK